MKNLKAVTKLGPYTFKDAVKEMVISAFKNGNKPEYDRFEEPCGSYTKRWSFPPWKEVLEHKYCAHDNEHSYTLTCSLAGWPITPATHEELECECFVCGTKFLRWFSKELVADPDDREHFERGSLCSYCTDEEVIDEEEEESFPEVT